MSPHRPETCAVVSSGTSRSASAYSRHEGKSTTGSAMAVVGFLMGAISTNQLLGQLGNFLGVGSCSSVVSDVRA